MTDSAKCSSGSCSQCRCVKPLPPKRSAAEDSPAKESSPRRMRVRAPGAVARLSWSGSRAKMFFTSASTWRCKGTGLRRTHHGNTHGNTSTKFCCHATTNYCYSHDPPLLSVLTVTTCEHSADVVTTSAVVVSADAIALLVRVLLHAKLVVTCYFPRDINTSPHRSVCE